LPALSVVEFKTVGETQSETLFLSLHTFRANLLLLLSFLKKSPDCRILTYFVTYLQNRCLFSLYKTNRIVSFI